jgi:hypothetical protein
MQVQRGGRVGRWIESCEIESAGDGGCSREHSRVDWSGESEQSRDGEGSEMHGVMDEL